MFERMLNSNKRLVFTYRVGNFDIPSFLRFFRLNSLNNEFLVRLACPKLNPPSDQYTTAKFESFIITLTNSESVK